MNIVLVHCYEVFIGLCKILLLIVTEHVCVVSLQVSQQRQSPLPSLFQALFARLFLL